MVYTLTRTDRTPLHTLLAAVLSLVVLWIACLMLGGVLSPNNELRRLALDTEMLSTALLSALFLILMGGLSRAEIFERSQRASVSLLSIVALIALVYTSDHYHHLFFKDLEAALRSEHPSSWGGPAYWATQLFCVVCSGIGIGLAVAMAWRGRTPVERNRALLVLGAATIPLVAHLVYVRGLLPIEYSLAPGTLGITAAFFVHAVIRYGFIVVRPVMRQDVIEHMADGILLADPQGVVLDANAAAERTLGRARDGLRGHSLADALDPLDPTRGKQSIAERIIALPLEGGRFREEIRSSDGRSIEITAGAVAALAHQPAGRFVSLRDCTEQRQSERLLQQKQKLESVGIMAAGVAHEVNNPLAYVRANLVHLQGVAATLGDQLKQQDSELAREPLSTLEEFPEVLEESIAGLDRIAEIVKSMLHFSRPSSDEPATMDVNALVDEALRLAALHGSGSVRVERRLAEDLPGIEVSTQGFVQVLLNLLLNARQALADQRDGVIIAQTRLAEGAIEITVEDNGLGIAKADIPQIFDPFFTTREPGQGTGLGLSIAFNIVRNHGGTLEYSPVDGGGARFVVRIAVQAQ